MPRKARKKSSTGIYHIVVRGIDRQVIFNDTQDYETYLSLLKYYKKECKFELYAYCLMSNHVHLMLKEQEVPIQFIFRKLNTSYVQWFNSKYERSGHLQQDRYYSEPIETIDYFMKALRYIHRNPLKASLESQIGESYRWTSFKDYVNHSNELTDISLAFTLFDDASFLNFMQHESDFQCLDVDTTKRRLQDDEARKIILAVSKCSNATDFQKLPMDIRNEYICKICARKVSANQLGRLIGISPGIIRRVVAQKRAAKFRNYHMNAANGQD